MGGAVSKVATKIKKQVNRTKAEDLFKFTPTGLMSQAVDKVAGTKTQLLFDPIGTASANVAERAIDKPKAEREEFKRIAGEAEANKRKAQDQFRQQKAQSEAEEAAASAVIKGRRRQARKKRQARDRNLTATLGSTSGSRRNLLGL